MIKHTFLTGLAACFISPLFSQKSKHEYDIPLNEAIHFDILYMRRTPDESNNPYTDTGKYLSLDGKSHSLGFGFEANAPFFTLALSGYLPIGGKTEIEDPPTNIDANSLAYRNATIWNFHIGPGIMTDRGLGLYLGYMYKYHYMQFKDVKSNQINFVDQVFYARSTGLFFSGNVPLGKHFNVGADIRGGKLKEGYGSANKKVLGSYNEFTVKFHFHSDENAADGLFFSLGSYSYGLKAPDMSTKRTGGGIFNIGITYTVSDMTKMLGGLNKAIYESPTGG